MLALMQCMKYFPEDGMANFSTVHQATDPMLTSIKLMVAFGPSISSAAKARLIWAYRIFTENGLGAYYQKNPQGILNLVPGGQVSVNDLNQCVLNLIPAASVCHGHGHGKGRTEVRREPDATQASQLQIVLMDLFNDHGVRTNYAFL